MDDNELQQRKGVVKILDKEFDLVMSLFIEEGENMPKFGINIVLPNSI